VSSFIQNLARRGAGLAPIVAVQPPFVPDFVPGPPTKLWRPASRVAGDIGNVGEIPHPMANSSKPVATPSREVGQEARPIRAAAPEHIGPPARSTSTSHPADSHPEPPGSPERAPDQGRNTQLHTPYSPEQQTSISATEESRERESWLPDQGELQPRSGQPVRADPARVSAGPSTSAPKPKARATSGSGSDPVAQSTVADFADSSPSQVAKQRYGPTVRAGAAQQVEEGPSLETKVDVSAGLLAAADSESQGSPDPGPAPATRGALSEADDSSRGSSTQEAREQSGPITQASTARRTEKRSNPEAAETAPETLQKRSNQEGAETVRLSSTTQPDEPAVKQAGSNPALVRTEEPLSGEPATSEEPASPTLVRPEPAPVVASPELVRPAPMIVSEQAPPQTSPPLRRPIAPQPEPHLIQVRIGSVEVRASTPPPASLPAPVQQGFDDYAAVRSYAGWEKA
jgi:hypothetical protein